MRMTFHIAAAMSYFGLMALFPTLLLLLAISNKIAAGSEMLSHAVMCIRVRVSSCEKPFNRFHPWVLGQL